MHLALMIPVLLLAACSVAGGGGGAGGGGSPAPADPPAAPVLKVDLKVSAPATMAYGHTYTLSYTATEAGDAWQPFTVRILVNGEQVVQWFDSMDKGQSVTHSFPLASTAYPSGPGTISFVCSDGQRIDLPVTFQPPTFNG